MACQWWPVTLCVGEEVMSRLRNLMGRSANDAGLHGRLADDEQIFLPPERQTAGGQYGGERFFSRQTLDRARRGVGSVTDATDL